jgi:tetratricopeptide (TPR) repeat protein
LPFALIPSPVASPRPASPSPSPSADASPPEPANPRVERAEKLLEEGRYGQALAEARAILARDPHNATAREVAQEAEASLAVEQALRRAREALARGERDDAIDELKRGLSIRPNDARLLDLWRQATQ